MIKYIVLVCSMIFLAACTQVAPQIGSQEQSQQGLAWDQKTFSDVDGNIINLQEYEVPVLIETFAVWCPTCLTQQKEVAKAHDALGDSFKSIALNVDPNENEELVRQYRDQHELGLTYAVAPAELTQALIAEFGNGIVQAPQTPLILYCNGEGTMLPQGVRSAKELQEAIDAC